MKSCRNCKYYEYGKCNHEEFDYDANTFNRVCGYIEWRFDGDIQSKLQEVIDNKVTLTDNEKESLIEDICNCIINDLTDVSNLKDGELITEFIPSFDFCCKHYE